MRFGRSVGLWAIQFSFWWFCWFGRMMGGNWHFWSISIWRPLVIFGFWSLARFWAVHFFGQCEQTISFLLIWFWAILLVIYFAYVVMGHLFLVRLWFSDPCFGLFGEFHWFRFWSPAGWCCSMLSMWRRLLVICKNGKWFYICCNKLFFFGSWLAVVLDWIFLVSFWPYSIYLSIV